MPAVSPWPRSSAAFGNPEHEAVVVRLATNFDQATPPAAAVQGGGGQAAKTLKFNFGVGREHGLDLS